jgi:nitrate/nitrite-specific signal transduction histidine kinase
MGLKLMAYRAGIIGARLDIAAGESGGTMIRVSGGQPSLP